MKTKLLSFVITTLFVLPFAKVYGQADTNSVKKDIVACADTMIKAFSTADYVTMERFTNANLVKLVGGKEKYPEVMKSTMAGMAGAKFEEATIGKVLQVVKTTTGFQCLVEQKIVLAIDSSRIKATSTLHGYSNSKGKIWKFADVGGKKTEQLKTLIPDFDKRLIIPKKITSTEKI